ncbi:MAG: type IV toxin-antitoxin system AbiEi family antitoxin domain-containing protein [Thermomicrobiales bacterium]
MRKTASLALLEQLANEQRHALSAWRGLIFLRRATFSIPPDERRWEQLPQYVEDLTPLFRQMRQRGEIKRIKGFRHLYEVTVPYARQGFVDEREVLFELHPYAVLSHLSALVFHGLTEEQPKGMTVTVSADVSGGFLPIGTGPRDWEGVHRPGGLRTPKILGRNVRWLKLMPERFFGFAEYQPLGFPMRYTTPERTLIDGLQDPNLSGGIANVLRSWVLARDMIDLDILVYQVERYNVAVLRQRVGYILDQVGLSHPKLEQWCRTSHRGGSSRLVGSMPFASTFDERWNLSLNAPVDVLHESLL